MQNIDVFTRASSMFKRVASGIFKMKSAFKFLSSGPRLGIGESMLPALQPGSSIVPSKTNLVMSDIANQVYAQVSGNNASISILLEGSEPDIDMTSPLIIKWLNESIKLIEKNTSFYRELH